MITADRIIVSFSRNLPVLVSPDGRTGAAVACVLQDQPDGPAVLFIQRAVRDGDPWSGDVGFPGGKIETCDGEPQDTAERETWEELGLRLPRSRCIGRLPDILGAHLPVHIACFVYLLRDDDGASFCLGDEAVDAFWVPLAELARPERHCTTPVLFRGERFLRPAIRLPQEDKPVLWGITYRAVIELLRILGLPPCSSSPDTAENV